MKKFSRFRLWLFLCALLGGACVMASGPQQALNRMADALTQKDSASFLEHMDMKAFAVNAVKNMTREDQALGVLDSVGKLLGLGSMEKLLGNVIDMEARQHAQFVRGVSTGELVARCTKAGTPDCPWVPESLRKAKIVEVDADAAVARVTTPANMASWLALRKVDGHWRVVGQAAMESAAREYAGQKNVPNPGESGAGQPKAAPVPEKRQSPPGAITI